MTLKDLVVMAAIMHVGCFDSGNRCDPDQKFSNGVCLAEDAPACLDLSIYGDGLPSICGAP